MLKKVCTIMIIFWCLLFFCYFLYHYYLRNRKEDYTENENIKDYYSLNFRNVFKKNEKIKSKEKRNMILLKQLQDKKKENYIQFPPIYCLMITGINDERIRFAVSSVRNFINQEYANKYLLIINQHTQQSVLDAFAYEQNMDRTQLDEFISERIIEFFIQKHDHLTLGMIRNISLQFVPMEAYWITWDDDDWRSNDFLKILYDVMYKNEAESVAFTKRYEYNANTNFSWMIELKSGLPHILSKKNPLIEYENLNSMEDIFLIKSMIDLGIKIVFLDNDPQMYIRLVHNNNTSEYVNPNKNSVHKVDKKINNKSDLKRNYIESEIKSQEKIYIIKKLNDLLAAKRE